MILIKRINYTFKVLKNPKYLLDFLLYLKVGNLEIFHQEHHKTLENIFIFFKNIF